MIKSKFTKNASYVLLITQLFSTISFAVLYSTLVLFMTIRLKMPALTANSLMGLFIAFNYGLHLLGGYIGGRVLSFRNLFIIGMVTQIIGCILLSLESITSLYWGLALFLSGSGLNLPCINMMLTQQFTPQSTQRETAFLWNYASMNVGFFFGFSMAGYFQLQQNFYTLFILSSLTNVIAGVLILIGWQSVKDKNTPLAKSSKSRSELFIHGIWGVIIILTIAVTLSFLLRKAHATNILMLLTCLFMFLFFWIAGLREKDIGAKKKIYAYIVLSLGGLVFWSLYQMAPMGLTLFAQNNIDRHVFGITIPPQWIGNINTIIIAIGGITLPPVFRFIRNKTTFGLPLQFTCSLTFIALGFLVLPLGIYIANKHGLVNFSWIAFSYILQSLGELMIGPIGYAMIGLLATERLQGLMMGSWMLLTGGTSGVIASYLSNFAIRHATSSNPIITNPGYSQLFLFIGFIALITAIILHQLVPVTRKLIGINQVNTRRLNEAKI